MSDKLVKNSDSKNCSESERSLLQQFLDSSSKDQLEEPGIFLDLRI